MEHQVKYSHQITYEYSFDATGIVVAIVFTIIMIQFLGTR